jgi:hypothetical protein
MFDMKVAEDGDMYFVSLVPDSDTIESAEERSCILAEGEYRLWLKLQEKRRRMVAAAGQGDPKCLGLKRNVLSGKRGSAGWLEERKKKSLKTMKTRMKEGEERQKILK